MNRLDKLLERAAAVLASRTPATYTLLYADGSTRCITGFMEAVKEVTQQEVEGDIVDVLDADETSRSLLLALRGPWDYSDIEELKDQLW